MDGKSGKLATSLKKGYWDDGSYDQEQVCIRPFRVVTSGKYERRLLNSSRFFSGSEHRIFSDLKVEPLPNVEHIPLFLPSSLNHAKIVLPHLVFSETRLLV